MATQGNGEFERWLERELRRTVATERAPSPLAAQAAYRDGSRRGGKLSVIRAGIAGKAVAGFVAAAVTVGAGSAVAMATTGSHSPVELVQNIAGLVAGCNGGDPGMRAPSSQAAGRCARSQGDQNQNGPSQQASGTRVGIPSQSPSPGKHEDHGQGNGGGLAQAPGQGNRGNGNGNGNGHGHKPSPTPHP